MSKRQAIIVDLDGTLVDSGHLLPAVHGPAPDYAAFHLAARSCEPKQWVLDDVLNAYRNNVHIMIITARSDQWKDLTADWLKDHNVPYDRLFMRGATDVRRDCEVKGDVYRDLMVNYDIIHAYEDNPEVAMVLDGLGISVTVVT